MDYGTRTFSDIYAAAAASFDADLWQLAFSRTVPIAIYVDAGDQSADYALEIGEWVNQQLGDLGFEEIESLDGFNGSYLQLNLCRTPKTDDGRKTEGKLRNFRRRLTEYLRESFAPKAQKVAQDSHSVVKIAVSVGTIVLLLTTAPAAPVVIGSFVVSAKVWTALAVAKEAGDIVESAGKLFTAPGDTTLKRSVTDNDPILLAEASEKRIRDIEERFEKRVREVEERNRRLEAEVKDLRRSSSP